jgi:hypothetical protein
MGPASSAVVTILALAFRSPTLRPWVFAWAIPHADDPWPLFLIRLPLSIFAPAQLLPYGFAVLQVTVVFGAAQVLLGVRTTAIVAFIGHVAAACSGRVWVMLKHPVGLGRHYFHFPDAGPSAAVVCLLTYIALTYRQTWLAVSLIIYAGIEIAVFNGLSQREHLVGILTGFVLYAAKVILGRSINRPPSNMTFPGTYRDESTKNTD